MSHDHKETVWSVLSLTLQDTVFRLPNLALRNLLCGLSTILPLGNIMHFIIQLLKAVCYWHTGKDLSQVSFLHLCLFVICLR